SQSDVRATYPQCTWAGEPVCPANQKAFHCAKHCLLNPPHQAKCGRGSMCFLTVAEISCPRCRRLRRVRLILCEIVFRLEVVSVPLSRDRIARSTGGLYLRLFPMNGTWQKPCAVSSSRRRIARETSGNCTSAIHCLARSADSSRSGAQKP